MENEVIFLYEIGLRFSHAISITKGKEFLLLYYMKHVCSREFYQISISKNGKYTVHTNGDTLYPQTCTFLHLNHNLHSPREKSDRKSNAILQ